MLVVEGMTSWQKHRRIIFPQVLPIALPSLGNALIDLLKRYVVTVLNRFSRYNGTSRYYNREHLRCLST